MPFRPEREIIGLNAKEFTVSKKPVGRPAIVSDDTILAVNSAKASAKLHADSDRRAVVNRIIAVGGKASLAELNSHFGYNVRPVVLVLITNGWLVEATA